jgi:hypothetical protein
MSYREPGVKVTQNFVNALPALATFALPNVSVGPAYQVVANGNAGTYSGSLADYQYPGQILGTFVDIAPPVAGDLIAYPVKVTLTSTVVQIVTAAGSGVVSGADLNAFSDTVSGAFANLLPGDVIVVTGSVSGNNGAYTVRSLVNGQSVKVNETFAAAEASLNYTVRRNIQATLGSYLLPADTVGLVVAADKVTLPASLTYDHPVFGTGKPIISATVLISYRALRVEKSADVAEYKKVSELQADFGLDQIVPENPVVYAAFLALNNSVTATNLLAVPQDFLTDELIGYSKAFDVLKLTDMYAISVLTHSPAVHTALKAHVDGMSDPNMKLERVGIANRTLVTKAVVVDSLTTGPSEGVTGPSGGPYTELNSAASTFLTDGVVPGMYVNITAPTGAAGRYKIGAVSSQTKIVLADAVPVSSNAVTFFVDKDLSKAQQASVIAAYAASLADRRMVLTWPDVVKIPVGATIRPLPGYFLNPCVGALTTGLPTQQGFTNLSVAVYAGVVHSTKYFDRDQLNAMAAGGVMIFVQDVLDVSALYIRHQLTTDTSAIKFQEYSVTKNVDFIAKFIRNNHKQFIGKYNIVDTTFDDLKSNAQGIITFLRDRTKLPKIGGVIKNGKLTTIEQDPSNIDTIVETWTLDIPIPLNNLDITIVV